jgi:large subunit ribosomal protein L29
MDVQELRGKSVDQLQSLLLQMKKESLHLRFQKASGELQSFTAIRQVRRNTARILTVLNEKRLAQKAGA